MNLKPEHMGDLFCLCNAFETDLRFRSMMRAANNKFTDFTTLKLMCSLAQLFSIERCIKSLIKRTSMIKEGLFFLTCDERRSPDGAVRGAVSRRGKLRN